MKIQPTSASVLSFGPLIAPHDNFDHRRILAPAASANRSSPTEVYARSGLSLNR
jgi:hypothetical protein